MQVPAAVQPTVVGGSNAVNNSLLQAITTVNAVGALFDRQAWGGLVTPVGGFFLGRQYTPGYEILNKYNVIGDQTALQFGQGFYQPRDPRQQFGAVSNRVAWLYCVADVRLWRLGNAAQ